MFLKQFLVVGLTSVSCSSTWKYNQKILISTTVFITTIQLVTIHSAVRRILKVQYKKYVNNVELALKAKSRACTVQSVLPKHAFFSPDRISHLCANDILILPCWSHLKSQGEIGNFRCYLVFILYKINITK